MKILSIGFRRDYLPVFLKEKLDIRCFVYSGSTSPPPTRGLDGAEIELIDEGGRFDLHEGAFDPSLDTAVADAARATGLQAYFRAHVRAVNRETTAPPDWGDMHHYFELGLNYWSSVLKRHEIDRVIFWILPHEGSFVTLYHLARAMGVRTTICTQTIYPNAFFMYEGLENYGQSPVIADKGLSIPFNDKPTSPFYTRNMVGSFPKRKWAGDAVQLAGKVALRAATLQFLWRRYSMQKSISKLKQHWLWYDHQVLNSSEYTDDKHDANFVYFPLHLQPEASCDIIGEQYCDQLLMVEEMRRHVPEDFWFYIKENPRQTALLRGETFFARSRAIPKVKLLRNHHSTFDLIERARIVATITGTAGYEALQMGKPVVCAGLSWYRGLPGVFDWRASPKRAIRDALAFKFDREELRDAIAQRSRTLWRGMIDPYYLEITPDFDAESNTQTIVEGIREYMAKTAEPKVVAEPVG